MRPGLAPIREGLEEDEWIIAAVETVINPVIAEKRLIKWYSGEGAQVIVGQDRAI